MAQEIDVENGRNSNFEGLVTLTLTFDPAIPHTVMHHSSTCSYMPNFMEMGRKKISKANTDVPNMPNFMEIGRKKISKVNTETSSKSRDTKTRANIKNPARSNLDIVP